MQRSAVPHVRRLLLLPVVAVLAFGSGCPQQGDPIDDDPVPTMTLGATKQLSSATLNAQGTTVRVDAAESVLNGMTITIPEGAFSGDVTITVSESEIIGHDFGSSLNPAVPLITIDNGGVEADGIITVKIPVSVPDETHVMAFYYDRATGDLEGIPELEHDAESITIMVNHFCDILLNNVAWQLILGSFDSGFEVGKDNWRFTNHGSYLSPGGICSGMSATSLYYYLQKKKKENRAGLYGCYDADDNRDTSGFEYDDAIGIKAASVAQYFERNFNSQMYDYWYALGKQKDDFWTFLMFAHALMLTKEPQYVSMFPENDPRGHAMVVYKKVGNALYVADPNEPTTADNKIEFEYGQGSDEFGTFKSYESKWNSGSEKIDFKDFFYVGKRSVVNWADLDDLWKEVDNGTVGSEFPDYDLKLVNPTTGAESALADGYTTTNSIIRVKVDAHGNFDPALLVYNSSFALVQDSTTGTVSVPLSVGDNLLGLNVEAEVVSPLDGSPMSTWTGFDWLTIRREAQATPTGPIAGIVGPANNAAYEEGDSVPFTGSGLTSDGQSLSGGQLVWTSSIDGMIGTGTSFSTTALSAGLHTITLTVTDANGLTDTDTMSLTVNAVQETAAQALVNGSWTASWANVSTGNGASGALSFNSDGTVALGSMWSSSSGTWMLDGSRVTLVFSASYNTSTWIGSINAALDRMEGTYSETLGNTGTWEADRNP